MNENTAESPGWAAIDGALVRLYGEREPDRHYGVMIPWRLGGSDPLDGLSAYKVVGEGQPHWHIVSYGMTELYEKESDDPETSGFGFEFTMRVACGEHDEEAPAWALNFLQNIGRYVVESGNVFDVGHHMNINGPIALGELTKIRAIAFCEAPRLPTSVESPNGQFGFLHVVGITLDELDAMQRWNSSGVAEVLRRRDPLLVTDLRRSSVLEDPTAAATVEEGRTREGSSQGGLFVSRLEWKGDARSVHVTIGAIALRGLRQLVEGRTLFGRSCHVTGPDAVMTIEPGERFSWRATEDGFELTIPVAGAEALRDLEVRRGRYQWPSLPGLYLTVEPTEVKDKDGRVVETIG